MKSCSGQQYLGKISQLQSSSCSLRNKIVTGGELPIKAFVLDTEIVCLFTGSSSIFSEFQNISRCLEQELKFDTIKVLKSYLQPISLESNLYLTGLL